MDGDTTLLTSSSLSYNRASNIAHAPDFPGHHALGYQCSQSCLSATHSVSESMNDYFNNSYICAVPRAEKSIQSTARLDLYFRAGVTQLSWGGDILREQSILDQDFNSDGTFTFAGAFRQQSR